MNSFNIVRNEDVKLKIVFKLLTGPINSDLVKFEEYKNN